MNWLLNQDQVSLDQVCSTVMHIFNRYVVFAGWDRADYAVQFLKSRLEDGMHAIIRHWIQCTFPMPKPCIPSVYSTMTFFPLAA
jgi:hypothetical protein